jgi:outer membrane protein assembly factor BamB
VLSARNALALAIFLSRTPRAGHRWRVLALAVLSCAVVGAIERQGRADLLAQAAERVEAAWRTWGGPRRDFVTDATNLFPPAEKWISAPPATLWERPLGDGYSGIAVEGGVLYTAYRRGSDDVVIAMDAATGKTTWEHADGAPFQNAYSDAVGPGPYSMPQVVGDRLIAVSGIGQVHSLDKKTGTPVWALDLGRQFGGTRLDFGYSSHPLPYKDTLIVLAGGNGRAVIKVRQSDGSVVWQRHSLQAAHSSPVLIDVDGQPQVVVLLANEIVGLDPESGDLLWRQAHETDNGLAISTPVWAPGNLLFVSTAYGGGARALRLTRTGAHTSVSEVWQSARIQSHFGSVIRQDDVVYLSSGQSVGILTAVDLATGRIRWQARDFVKAQLVAADGRLIVLDEDGNLGLGVATPDRFQAIAKWRMLSSVAWTPPTLAGTRLYLRDRKVIRALDFSSLR